MVISNRNLPSIPFGLFTCYFPPTHTQQPEGTRLFHMNSHVPKATCVIGVKKAAPLLPRTSHTAVCVAVAESLFPLF